jgi:two-component system, sensor histidine kinase
MLSSNLVRSALDSAPDATVIVDASGSIVFASHQVAVLFGYEVSELQGRNIDMLLPERFRDRHVHHRRMYSESLRTRPMGVGLDLFALRRDGAEFPVEISLSPISDGIASLVVASIRDITEHRSIESALHEARETAERANQAKSRFLATASHDLRQPLQTLALLNGTMRRMLKDEQVAEVLVQEEQAIGAMSRLLNALLDISKLESGAIRPEVTDFKVAEIFTELRSEFASLAADKGLTFVIDSCADYVHSDPSLIGQVLRNLVSNAIKYTREGCVQLRCLHDRAFVRLQVLDTGVGIPANELIHIYDEFYQVGVGTNTSRDGFGLGLSIVSRIVQLLGLKLDVQSEVGKGSVFSLELPLGAGHADSARCGVASAPRRQGGRGDPPHVLLVEDDPGVLNATRMLLKVEGYRVTTAGSLAEALQHAAKHRDIALLLTDFHLANGETGVEVIEAVRQYAGIDLGAVLVTGDTSSAVRALPRDARLRLASKPISPDELLGLMRELLPSSS